MNENATKCPLCGSDKTTMIAERFQSAVEDFYYSIYRCGFCETQFAAGNETSKEIYEALYSSKTYGEYSRYASEIKSSPDPLKYLSEQEITYVRIYNYINRNMQRLLSSKILEVGSGLGYLTYALNVAGLNATGIDISEEAVKKAKQEFGEHYIYSNIENLSTNQTFDVIIAAELIEHVMEPLKFIEAALKILSDDGELLITTPNYSIKSQIWRTELPPVHMFWFSRRSFEVLAKIMNVNCSFIMPEKGSKIENYLVTIMSVLFWNGRKSKPYLSADLKIKAILKKSPKSATLKNLVRMLNFRPVRDIVNRFFYPFAVNIDSPLCVVLKKSKKSQCNKI
ncbi:MAG: class I SAM-dependent methyltransferase [Candidatus Thermoplasmatota archaeon]|nr:class I SAM-dependent methyltransferase [Candidatus Thermoplasmatota archaeon]